MYIHVSKCKNDKIKEREKEGEVINVSTQICLDRFVKDECEVSIMVPGPW
jgi:hypothetical protein